RRHTRSKRDWSSDVCSSDLNPITFEDAIDRVGCVARFLSVVAGRMQGIADIQIGLAGEHADERQAPLNVHWSYAPKAQKSSDSLDRKSTRLNSSHVSISYAV